MSDLHEAAMSALLHDLRERILQADEQRGFNDALAAYLKSIESKAEGNKSEQ